MTFDHDDIADVLCAELRKQGAFEEGGIMCFDPQADNVRKEGAVVVEIYPIVHAIIRSLAGKNEQVTA